MVELFVADFNVPVGPSQMIYATGFPPIARPIQRQTSSVTHQSISESAQADPSVTPVQPQAQTAASFSPLPRIAAFLQPAFLSTTAPTQAETAHPPPPMLKEKPSPRASKGISLTSEFLFFP